MSMRDLMPWGRQESRPPAMYERRRDPFTTLRREMERLFDDTFGLAAPVAGQSSTWPSLEVSETDNEVRVTAEMPGLAEKDIDLTVENGVLCLRGERRSEVDDKERGYSERFFGRFERRVALPTGVDEEKADARFDNGVLTVTIPKSPEIERGRRIPINDQTRH
jgi:HSP20 family protein